MFIRFDEENAFFLTDARYTTEAAEFITNATVVDAKRELAKCAKTLIRKFAPKSVAYDPKDFSVERFGKLSSNLKVRFIPLPNLSLKKREIKTLEDINALKKAADEGKKAFERFGDFIKNQGFGMSEEELFFNAELLFKDRGKLSLSFPPIVAINENAAKPHALPTKKKLREGDLLLLDAGVLCERYCSDRTRSVEVSGDFTFSKEQKFKDALKQKVYDTVLLAQQSAIKIAKEGVRACDIDKAARDVIDKAGFGKYFIHSTGHGVGLDIHELPVISSKSQTIIAENMLFTIEPGIYLPDKFGVRIEDMVVIQNGKALVL